MEAFEAVPAGLPCTAEVHLRGQGKEVPVAHIVASHGGTAADCIAFGDGLNDISMVRFSDYHLPSNSKTAVAVPEQAQASAVPASSEASGVRS
jgi:phosphoserine phosphatase